MNIKVLKELSITEIRKMYWEYLEAQNLSPNTIQTSCTDAFYLMRNNGSLNFWEMLDNPNYEKIAFKQLKLTLMRNSRGNVNANINGYMAYVRRFKKFIEADINGNYENEEEAAIQYDKKAIELYGIYAKLNFPEPQIAT